MVIRRSLGRQLKRLRESADNGPGKRPGKSLAEVAATKIMSKAKLAKLEGGKNAVRVGDVMALCQLYRVAEAESQMLTSMASAADNNGEDWRGDYADAVPSWFGLYVDLESAAAELWDYSPTLVPGLLQISEYHQAVFQSDPVLVANDDLDRQLELRAERRRRAFDRATPLRMVTILDEGALRRHVGGKEVMESQIEHLVKMSTCSNVDVFVLPNEAGAHPGMKGAFTRMGFGSETELDAIYMEALDGGRYVEGIEQVERFGDIFGIMRTQAIAIGEFIR